MKAICTGHSQNTYSVSRNSPNETNKQKVSDRKMFRTSLARLQQWMLLRPIHE